MDGRGAELADEVVVGKGARKRGRGARRRNAGADNREQVGAKSDGRVAQCGFVRVRPGRQPRDHIELAQKLRHHLIGVLFGG